LVVHTDHSLRGIVTRGASVRKANPRASEDALAREAVGSGVYDVGEHLRTDRRVADHFAVRDGLDPTEELARPPFQVAVPLVNGGRIRQTVADGHADVGGIGSAPVEESTRPDRIDDERFVDHPPARGGVTFAVNSDAVVAGVTSLARADLLAIRAGEVTNWSADGGPDADVYLVGAPTGTASPTLGSNDCSAARRRLADGPRRALRAGRDPTPRTRRPPGWSRHRPGWTRGRTRPRRRGRDAGRGRRE
jgi:hypothetical protein